MESAKWIKLNTDMLGNRKILYLRRQPEGDSLVLLWVMLLLKAGQCNDGGRIYFTPTIPYTPKLLGEELGMEMDTTQRALDTFIHLDMLTMDEEGIMAIAGWEKHQNVEAMEKVREGKRLAQARWRNKRKEKLSAVDSNVDTTVDSTVDAERISVDHAEEDKEIERDIEIDKKKKSKKEKGADAREADAKGAASVTQHSLLSMISESSFSNALKQHVEDWVQYKAERKEGYKEQGFRALLRQIESNAAKYGEQAVCELMEQSMASGWKGIIFDRLKEPMREESQKRLYVSKGVYINPDDYINGPALGWGDCVE